MLLIYGGTFDEHSLDRAKPRASSTDTIISHWKLCPWLLGILKIIIVCCENFKNIQKMPTTPNKIPSEKRPVYSLQVINTPIYTIGDETELNTCRGRKRRRRQSCRAVGPSSGATSAHQLHDLRAVHALFCCRHASTQAVGCMLSVPLFWRVFACDIRHLGLAHNW